MGKKSRKSASTGQGKKHAAAFDAAGRGRRLATWRPPRGESINAQVLRDATELRDRSRDAVHRTPLGATAERRWVANVIGTGIKPSTLVRDPSRRQAIQELWLDWTDEADADGLADFYGLQAMAARAMFTAGECFIRLRPRRLSDGLAVPLQLQLLESEHVPLTLTRPADNGNTIRGGIELDALGRRVAYHMYRAHPGDPSGGFASAELVRVPAEEVIHVFEPTRPGQLRGIPRLSSVLLRMYDLDKFDDAELVRQLSAAMFVGFLHRPPGPDGPSPLDGEDVDADGVPVATLESGTIQELPEGWDIKFSAPPASSGYQTVTKRQDRQISLGAGLTYEQATGDLEGVNYSSIRQGVLDARREIEALQHNVIVYRLCRPVWRRWLDAAVLSGALDLPGYAEQPRRWWPVKWIPQAWPWIDPLKDRLAEQLAVRCGFKSRSDVIEAEGYDPEEVEGRIIADNARADRGRMIFDSDPRHTEKAGGLQSAEDRIIKEST